MIRGSGTVEPGLMRGTLLPLAIFSGVSHGGAAVLLTLMVLGVLSAVAGAASLFAWSVFSLCASLVGYVRMEERRRREAVSRVATFELPLLASKVVELYARPETDAAVAEVYELYRRAQRNLEEGDYRGAREAIGRGVALAGVILEEKGQTQMEGEGSWK